MNIPDIRKGYTQYEIEISDDGEGGYYFDIYRMEWSDGDDFKIKEYLPEAYESSDHPFKTREEAIEAGKHWLKEHKQGDAR